MGSDHFVTSLFLNLLLLTLYSSPLPVRGNAELRSLMEVKSSLDPENKLLSSWTENGDPCTAGSFEGVACNEDRKVVSISLQGKGLSGKVSPALAELKCLSGLYLHYNNLYGEIPTEIFTLTELTDLYLDFNSLSGPIPVEIGNMENLQVLQICCNQLTGNIPPKMGSSLKRLTALALQHNKLTGSIPANLGDLEMLRSLDLSFNGFFGPIPITIASIPQLKALDVQNNSLSGIVPSGLKRLNEGFHGENNPSLCGVGFSTVRICAAFDSENVNTNQFEPPSNKTGQKNIPESVNIIQPHCTSNQTHCSKPTKRFSQTEVIIGVSILTFLLTGVLILTFFWYRRRKQKMGSTSDSSDDRLSTDRTKDIYSKNVSPLVSLEYSNGWDSLADRSGNISRFFFQDDDDNNNNNSNLSTFRFNVEEVESATQYFSEMNLLGKTKTGFSSVYRGILRDGSVVAIRSINMTSCKSEEAEFLKGLKFLTSLRHDNLVRLRGFCCSRGRGEFYLIYDYASKRNLSCYLDNEDGKTNQVLEWPNRVSIINDIANGIAYLHRSEENKPAMVHQNISVEKILIDEQFKPLISDSGLPRLLADDIVFSALKVSAAMGYLAPEYITTGRFTEKSDVYAFGVIVLQILSGMQRITTSIRSSAESCRVTDVVDKKLKGIFSESEAERLIKVAALCTHELPTERPLMEDVIQDLSSISRS